MEVGRALSRTDMDGHRDSLCGNFVMVPGPINIDTS